jgi:hypothetical protein
LQVVEQEDHGSIQRRGGEGAADRFEQGRAIALAHRVAELRQQ